MPETSSTARRGGNLAIWSQDAAVDADGDGISNSLEQTLISFGRLPAGADTKKDSDLDGLSDFVELVGVPATSLAGGDSSLAMPWQGSLGGPDPAVQDLFIEVDWMEDAAPATAHSHEPYANLAADLTSIFTSDSAWTGRNIRVHLDRSQSVGHWDRISYSTCGGAGDVNFYTIKNNSSFFDPLRNLVYHYVVVAHSEKNTACVATASSGRAEIFGNDVYVTFGGTNGTNLQQRGTHVHEMGHNLYLDHNSNDDAPAANRSCVHSSVMNYRYQLGGWTNAGDTLRASGYSNGTCLSGNTGNACVNTCTSRCVPSGQVSPKITCPLATSGPNAGTRVSNGTCDCDRTEWTAPGATPVANRVSLAFQTSGEASDGAPLSAAERQATEEASTASRLTSPTCPPVPWPRRAIWWGSISRGGACASTAGWGSRRPGPRLITSTASTSRPASTVRHRARCGWCGSSSKRR